MIPDQTFIERNRAATNRIRGMAKLSDAELRTPVGEHWTVAILLAHLAFWDLRAMFVLDTTEQDGKLFNHQADSYVNDYILPLMVSIQPREAARLAVESAERLDARLEMYSPNLLEEVRAANPRWVDRSLHRNAHLDEAEAALREKKTQGA